jgi:MSHA biogenesis protein MshG
MALFHFKGRNSSGHIVEGTYKAKSQQQVKAYASSLGITVILISKIGIVKSIFKQIRQLIYRAIPVNRTTLSTFYYQMAGMLEIDISVKNSLLTISNHLTNPRFVHVVNDVINQVTKGHSLSAAMARYKKVFSSSVVYLISLAHSRKELIAVFNYCDQVLYRFLFKRKLLLTIFPQLVILVVILMVMAFFRLHYLNDFYYAVFVYSQKTPGTIAVFAWFTSLFTIHLAIFTVAVVASIICISLLVRLNTFFKYIFDIVLMHLPVVRSVLLVQERERLSLIFGMLLRGGATTQNCAQYASLIVENSYFKRRVQKMAKALMKGDAFSETIKRYKVFSSSEIQLISLGEVSNNLAKTFSRIYKLNQLLIEKKFILVTEVTRAVMYVINTALFLFTIYAVDLLFFYPSPP